MNYEELRNAINDGEHVCADSIESARDGDLMVFYHPQAADEWAREHFAGTGLAFAGYWTEEEIEIEGNLLTVNIAAVEGVR